MLERKEKRENCPFRKDKECSDKCILFRRGTRTVELTSETISIEACAINVIADNLEAMHNRTYMLQQEVGQTKNVMAFHVLANMGLASKEEAERQAKQILIPVVEEIEKKQLLEK